MRAAAGGGGGTIVVDIPGVVAASGRVGEAGQAFGFLARRIASHPLPDMPGGTLAVVEAALADAASMLAPLPEDLIAVAQELRVRAFWAEIADRLLAGSGLSGTTLKEFQAAYASGLLRRYAESWQKDLADAYAKKLYDDAHPGGLLGALNDVGHFFKGAFDAVKDTDLMIYHLSPYSPDPGKYWLQLGEGVAHGVTHPVEFGEQIIDLPALERHGFSYWLGNMTPAVAAALLSGGAGAAARGAEGVVALDDLAEGAVTRAGAMESAPRGGMIVSRMYGAPTDIFDVEGGARPFGASWTPLDPASMTNPRAELGLPNQNPARFVIRARLNNPADVKLVRRALPLDGQPGGAPEFIIPDAEEKLTLLEVYGVNPSG